MSPSWSAIGPVNSDAWDAVGLSKGPDDELRARVKGELEPGERVLWAGRSLPPRTPPAPGYYLAGATAMALLGFGAINCIRALGRPRGFPDDGSMPLGSFLCVIGVLVSLGLIGTLINRRTERTRDASVCYAVTNHRILSWTPDENSDGIRVCTMPGAQISSIERIQRPDGSGDLELYRAGDNTYRFGQASFKHIPEVRRVEQIIRNNLMIDRNRTQVERDRSEDVGDIT